MKHFERDLKFSSDIPNKDALQIVRKLSIQLNKHKQNFLDS